MNKIRQHWDWTARDTFAVSLLFALGVVAKLDYGAPLSWWFVTCPLWAPPLGAVVAAVVHRVVRMTQRRGDG